MIVVAANANEAQTEIDKRRLLYTITDSAEYSRLFDICATYTIKHFIKTGFAAFFRFMLPFLFFIAVFCEDKEENLTVSMYVHTHMLWGGVIKWRKDDYDDDRYEDSDAEENYRLVRNLVIFGSSVVVVTVLFGTIMLPRILEWLYK